MRSTRRSMVFGLVLIISSIFAFPVFAQVDIDGPETTGNLSPIGGSNAQAGATASATGGAGGSATIADNSKTYNNNSLLSNIHLDVDTDIRNKNILSQTQELTNQPNQTVAPVQSISIETPQALLGAPSQSIPEINFGHGKMDWNFAKQLPMVTIPIYDAKETVIKEVAIKANVKAKNYLSAVLGMIEKQLPLCSNDRLIVIKAEAQKSWNTGGNVGGAGSYLPTSGLAGASGAGSIVPSWGGTKADDLYTIIIVRVAWK